MFASSRRLSNGNVLLRLGRANSAGRAPKSNTNQSMNAF
jgi:hypothetical protein